MLRDDEYDDFFKTDKVRVSNGTLVHLIEDADEDYVDDPYHESEQTEDETVYEYWGKDE
jgi:hypothetical protein